MYQIGDDQAVADRPALPTDRIGVPGWFTGGLAALGLKATRVRAYWLNMIQAEIMAVVARAGIALAKGVDNQLLAAILALIGRANIHVSVFTTPGNATWVAPAGDTQGFALAFGGGGGGSNCQGSVPDETGANFGGGGGAGGGGFCLFGIPAGGFSVGVTVPAGGGSQADGGTAAFGGYIAATGGRGASFQNSGAGVLCAGGAPGVGYLGADLAGLAWGGGCGSDGQDGSDHGFGNGGAYSHARDGVRYPGGNGAPGVVMVISWGAVS